MKRMVVRIFLAVIMIFIAGADAIAAVDEAQSKREALSAVSTPPAWGTIMYPRPRTNIRAKRSATSSLKGRLKEGRPVRADFLQGGWYAVFSVTEEQRDEKKALGYVFAPLLSAKYGPVSSNSSTYGEKLAKAAATKSSGVNSPPVDIKDISFRITRDGKELLFIEFNRFYLPTLSGIEGEEPRIILEIKNASPLKEDWEVIETEGKFIRTIRSRMDSKTDTATIVLEMEPSRDYFLKPSFFEKDNTYALEISEVNETSPP
jgi:hypothetical protein